MALPSEERGCRGKINLGRRFKLQADRLSQKHGKSFGVYRCPHCGGTHLTTKLEKSDQYPPLLYAAHPRMTDKLERFAFYQEHPAECLKLIEGIAHTCYRAWDTWDIGEPIYGVQLAYLFATIASCREQDWVFALDMTDKGDGVNPPLHEALASLFPEDHDIWVFVDLHDGSTSQELLQHSFEVQISGCTREQAEKVLRERLGHDEDYGFAYTLNW